MPQTASLSRYRMMYVNKVDIGNFVWQALCSRAVAVHRFCSCAACMACRATRGRSAASAVKNNGQPSTNVLLSSDACRSYGRVLRDTLVEGTSRFPFADHHLNEAAHKSFSHTTPARSSQRAYHLILLANTSPMKAFTIALQLFRKGC